MTIIGYQKSDFKAKDGTDVKGFNVFIAAEVDSKLGEGYSVEKVYLSEMKLAREEISLKELLNKDVKIYFNKFGKVESIIQQNKEK